MITKCLNARPKTKEKGINIILMYIEVEKQDVVQVREERNQEKLHTLLIKKCSKIFVVSCFVALGESMYLNFIFFLLTGGSIKRT